MIGEADDDRRVVDELSLLPFTDAFIDATAPGRAPRRRNSCVRMCSASKSIAT